MNAQSSIFKLEKKAVTAGWSDHEIKIGANLADESKLVVNDIL